jgi:anti-sigma regulatory factor (Ser/Thr protein kinase)
MKIIKIINQNRTNWIGFIGSNRYNIENAVDPEKKILIDFEFAPFLEPYHIVSLACLIEEYHINGYEVLFIKSLNHDINIYLCNIHFFDYWKMGFDRTVYKTPDIKSALNLWKIDPCMISNYVVQAQKYFQDNFLKNKNVEPLNISLAELFNNIFDHSESQISGFCLSQYYPKNDKLKIAVCDFGIGIPQRIIKYRKDYFNETLSESIAILNAFELNFSTKSKPHNRGFGLDTIKNIIRECNGSLRLFSNNTVFHISDVNTYFSRLPSTFNGTLFDIQLDTLYFDDSEDINDGVIGF